MLIDRKNSPWIVATALLGVVAVGVYVWDTPHQLRGPSGSTVVGLTFGIAAFAIMLFCAALGLKRRVPHWRLGKAQTWLRGHIWLGLLSVLLVALHAAFRAGGPLTIGLWCLLGVVTVSGIVGVILQQLIPSLLLHSVPGETVAQQLARQIESLDSLGEEVVKKFAGGLDSPSPAWVAGSQEAAKPPVGGEPLRLFFIEHARPFLRSGAATSLARPTRSETLFASLRIATPPHIHPGINALEELCDRRRQLLRQRRLMRVLMFWLLFHVPMSWTLLLATAAHAVIALRYQ
jgi:hypothetical protein